MMKDLKSMVNAAARNGGVTQHAGGANNPPKAITEETIIFVNKVMKTILANSPAWSVSLKGSESVNDYRQQLVKAFLENDIAHMAQVELGLKRIRKEETNFLPSVGQFISWCSPSPEAINCPDVDDAYKEACFYRYSKKPISHPCIAYALAKITMFDLSNKSEATTKPRFAKYYQTAVERFYYGDNLQKYVERYQKPKADDSLQKLADLRDDPQYQQRSIDSAKKHIADVKAKLKKAKHS